MTEQDIIRKFRDLDDKIKRALCCLSQAGFGLTEGSVVFGGPTGDLSQDNSNFFWDDTNNRLGIGTNTPTMGIDLVGSDALINSLRLGRGAGQIISNAIFGLNAGDNLTTADFTVAIGWHAMSGGLGQRRGNTAIGSNALAANNSNFGVYMGINCALNGGGELATAIGMESLNRRTGPTNLNSFDGITVVGARSGYWMTTNAINNTCIGHGAGASITDGDANVAIGILSMGSGTPFAVGGSAQITGNQNNAVGGISGFALTSGSGNNFFGYNSGLTLSTGSNNLFLGHSAGSAATTISSAVIIGGHNGTGVTSNQILIADGAGTERIRVTSTGNVILAAIQEFADNAAAIVGGLAVGTIYRTGDALKIVH